MDFSSKLLEQAVNEMAQLPGIGKRTALRMVLHLLKQPKQTLAMTKALDAFRTRLFAKIFLTFPMCRFVKFAPVQNVPTNSFVWWKTSGDCHRNTGQYQGSTMS